MDALKLALAALLCVLAMPMTARAQVQPIPDTPIHVLCDAGTCGGASAFSDGAVFTGGSTPVNLFAGVFDDALADATSGTAVAARLTNKRALHINLRDASGAELGTVANPLHITGGAGGSADGAILDGVNATVKATVTGANALKVDGSAVTQPVSGTFFQATQPVSGTFWQATQPVSGTVTANAGTGTFAVSGTFWQATQPVSGTFWQATQPISGTVTANAGTNLNTSALALSATQTDRTQKTQITDGTRDGTVKAASTAAAAADTSVVVALSPNSPIPTGANTIGALTANQSVNVAQIAGATTSTAASGVQKVGIVGNAGAALDAANNAAMPANAEAIGLQTATIDTSPTAATAGNLRYQLASTEGVAYVQEGGPKRFSCFVTAVTATTQCQAAPGAGLRAYVTSVTMSNQAATVLTLDLVFGTGTNCATGTAALTHKVQFGTLATTSSPQSYGMSFTTPLVPTAANAICVRPGGGGGAFGATITGYIAP